MLTINKLTPFFPGGKIFNRELKVIGDVIPRTQEYYDEMAKDIRLNNGVSRVFNPRTDKIIYTTAEGGVHVYKPSFWDKLLGRDGTEVLCMQSEGQGYMKYERVTKGKYDFASRYNSKVCRWNPQVGCWDKSVGYNETWKEPHIVGLI